MTRVTKVAEPKPLGPTVSRAERRRQRARRAAYALMRLLGDRKYDPILELMREALSYVMNDKLYGNGRTKKAGDALRAAHATFLGGQRAWERDTLIGYVEDAVTLTARIGSDAAATALAQTLGEPDARVPLIAARLSRHVVRARSGRGKAGEYTTRQIVEWITGDHESARHLSRRKKPKRKGRT